MKKYLAVLLGILLILSFTLTAFAQDKPEITLGGKIVLRGWYFDNIANTEDSLALPSDNGSEALYTSNVYLTVDAKIADNVRAFIELESAAGTAGSQYSGVYYWGNYDGKANADMLLRQAWVQYTGSGLLGVPTGLKAGHMLFSLGEKQFLDLTRFGTDAILVWVDPTKELHLAAGTAKFVESTSKVLGDISSTADMDAYILLGTYMLDKDNTLGLNYTWVHSNGNIPSLAATEGIPNVDSLDLHNVMLHANGKVAGVSYALEGDMQFGSADNVYVLDSDLDFKGWAAMVKLGYMLDPVNIRGSFAMGSGDDDIGDGDLGEFQALVGTDQIGAIARYTHYTLIYERMIRTAAVQQLITTNSGGNIRTTGIANTTYFNLGFDVNPMKELSLSLDGFFLQATETDAWETVTDRSVDESLGWEVDLKMSYKLAKNLSYFVEAGYFDAGDFYDDVWGENNDIDSVTYVMHGLKVEF